MYDLARRLKQTLLNLRGDEFEMTTSLDPHAVSAELHNSKGAQPDELQQFYDFVLAN